MILKLDERGLFMLPRCLSFLILFAISSHCNAQVAVVDSAGLPIGLFLQQIQIADVPEGPLVFESLASDVYRYHLVSTKGYQFLFDIRYDQTSASMRDFWLDPGDDVGKILFGSIDCSGQAYVFGRYSGFLTKSRFASSQVFYAPKGTAVEPGPRSFLSYLDDASATGCSITDTTASFAVKAFPNDPAVTGYVDHQFTPPLMFETSLDPGLAQCLFKDGFECQLLVP